MAKAKEKAKSLLSVDEYGQHLKRIELEGQTYLRRFVVRLSSLKEGKKVRLNMPRIGVGYEHLGLPPSVHHDGRHRMLALLRLGHGDTPVPVHVNDMQEFETGEKWQPPEDTSWLDQSLEYGPGMG